MLRSIAARLLDDLEARHEVRREVGLELDPDLARRTDVESIVRLIPSHGEGAPVTVASTSFPGVIVRFGAAVVTAYPTCGCDECAEDVEDLARDLTGRITDVAAGRFRETVRGTRLVYRFTGVWGTGELEPGSPFAPRNWGPWPIERASGSDGDH